MIDLRLLERVFDTGGVRVEMERLREELAKQAGAELWPLSDDEAAALLRTAHQIVQLGGVLQARLAQEAGGRGIPEALGFRSQTSWLRSTLRIDPHHARQIEEHATAMRRPALRQAVIDGRLNLPQTVTIEATRTAVLTDLGGIDEVGPAETGRLADQAEGTQIAVGAELSPGELRKVGERILAHLAPHVAEQAEERGLHRRRARRGFTLAPPDDDGMVRVSGLLTPADAATVKAALHPLCRPVSGDERTAAQCRADALVHICHLALRTGSLPADGGQQPQVVVTVPYDVLARTLGPAALDNGQPVPAATLRQLACDARILPMVLGGAGGILDAGRSRRLVSGTLRRALVARDRGCVFPECDRPPEWTDAHHAVSWQDGGRTDLTNTMLLCRHHHTVVHDPASGWTVRFADDGRPEFIPPRRVDPEQRPRRNNHFHLRC